VLWCVGKAICTAGTIHTKEQRVIGATDTCSGISAGAAALMAALTNTGTIGGIDIDELVSQRAIKVAATNVFWAHHIRIRAREAVSNIAGLAGRCTLFTHPVNTISEIRGDLTTGLTRAIHIQKLKCFTASAVGSIRSVASKASSMASPALSISAVSFILIIITVRAIYSAYMNVRK